MAPSSPKRYSRGSISRRLPRGNILGVLDYLTCELGLSGAGYVIHLVGIGTYMSFNLALGRGVIS